MGNVRTLLEAIEVLVKELIRTSQPLGQTQKKAILLKQYFYN